MENGSILSRLGFSDNDLDRKRLVFPHDDKLSNKLGTVFYYGKDKSEQVKTRFYWVKTDGMSLDEIKAIHERIWNENKADLLFLEKTDAVDIKYASTSPKHKLLEIASIPTNIEDAELLDKISKKHITTGAFWIEYNSALDRIKKQHKTVDQALVESLGSLRKELDNIYRNPFPEKELRSKIVQALIDRTLFIKFLEDKKIINSVFYQKYFGNKNIHYKDLLQDKENAKGINELFCRINEVFNNKLFETPVIEERYLLNSALTAIARAISGTKNGQLCLFDFQFDIIPIEFISHIYQIFLDDKKAKQGIFYTPEGLANLLLDNVIEGEGAVLDPSCGSGIFLVLAFRKMYSSPVDITGTYEKIQHRLAFIKKNIFGIEIENTAARLALFSLYLEVLNDMTSEELNKLITDIIQADNNTPLFSIDFSDNIQQANALIEGEKSPFMNKKFRYIVGNPPWFVISQVEQNENDRINYSYWNKYRDCFSRERQISQCFLYRIKSWSTGDTKFGFIVNSSNFTNESDSFQSFIYSSYRLDKIFELYHLKKILFDYADEPATLLVFDNNISQTNTIKYFLPRLNSFAETFKTILLNQNEIINIRQSDLLNRKIKLRDFLIGTENELLLANRIGQESSPIIDIMLVDKKYDSLRGFEDWGKDALRKEFGKEKGTLSNEDYNSYKETLLNKYFNKTKDTIHTIPFLKSAQLDRFHTKEIDTFCIEDISNFHRPRNSFIYEGEKILCSRIGGEIKAIYSSEKIYFGTDIYVVKLKDPQFYHAITCCLNSEVVNYYSQVKLRKRIDSALSRLDTPDLKKIPVPKKFDSEIVVKLTRLSKSISSGVYSFEEKKEELNELVCDLYELDYIERQRISDFFVNQNQHVANEMFTDYCDVFFKTFRRVLKTGIVKMEYSYNPIMPFDITGVKITFGNSTTKHPTIDKVQLSINYQLLKQVGNSVLISLKERIYSEDSIFIIKDLNPKNWTKSAAYDDANTEIEKLLRK